MEMMNVEKFAESDLSNLRNELMQSGLDTWQAAEMILCFLSGRGYGVSHQDARTAVSRIESSACSIECMQQELERLAMVM